MSEFEDHVVEAAWEQIKTDLSIQGELVLHYPDDRAGRDIDGLGIAGVAARTVRRQRRALRGKLVFPIEAKAGEVSLGLLGQSLVAAELLAELAEPPAAITPVAAAPRGNALIADLAAAYQRPIRVEVIASLEAGRRSSKPRNPQEVRLEVARRFATEPGTLIAFTAKARRPTDFAHVRVVGSDLALSALRPTAVYLPGRPRPLRARGAASWLQPVTAVTLERAEPVVLIYCCEFLGRSLIGEAVFGGELARGRLGLDAVTVAAYPGRREPPALRRILDRLVPGAALPL